MIINIANNLSKYKFHYIILVRDIEIADNIQWIDYINYPYIQGGA